MGIYNGNSYTGKKTFLLTWAPGYVATEPYFSHESELVMTVIVGKITMAFAATTLSIDHSHP